MASVARRWQVLLLGLSAVLAACGTGRTPPAAAPSPAASSAVVPWADLPPARAQVPTVRTPVLPDPGPAERAPRCRAGRLRVAIDDVGGAGGTLYWFFTIRSTGGPPCSVSGTPGVVLLTGGAHDGVPVQVEHAGAGGIWAYRHPVLLDRTHTAMLRVGWAEDWCAPPVRVDALRLTIAGESVRAPGLGRTPVCNGGTGPTPVMVWPLFPSDYREGSVTTAWDRVAVRSPSFRHLSGVAGATLAFTVTLRAPRDLSLSVCPDYEVYLIGDSTRTAERHQLNCAAVPFHLSDGTPYLPGGRAVRFAMQVTAPATAAPKGIWRIAIPSGGLHGLAADGSFTPAPTSTATP